MNAGQTLMRAMLEAGPNGASKEQLVTRAGIGHATFYRVLRPLMEKGLVDVRAGQYRLPMSNPYNFRFKLWNDMERLYELEPVDRDAVLDIANAARNSLGNKLLALLLVGSAAHGALRPDSDLDFLAVCRKDVMYHPQSARATQFVVMTDRVFRGKHQAADDFVCTALRHGIVLHDGDYLQSFYLPHASTGRPADSFLADEEALDRATDNLHFMLQQNEFAAAGRSLKGYAVTLGRLMLRALGQLPAGKPDMLELLELLFGPSLHQAVCQGIEAEDDPPSAKEMLHRHRVLDTYRQRFRQHLSHLAGFAALPTSHGIQMETLTGNVMTELFDDVTAHDDADFVVHANNKEYLIQCKSALHEVPDAVDDQLQELRRQHKNSKVVLVANPHSKVPLLDRPPPKTRLSSAKTISVLQLLRCHNMLHLENMQVAEARRLLLHPPEN